MDPGGLTLRQLARMARERKRVMGELQAVLMAFVAEVLTGKPVKNVNDLNPYRVRSPAPPPPPKSPAQIESESAAGWRLLNKFFGG